MASTFVVRVDRVIPITLLGLMTKEKYFEFQPSHELEQMEEERALLKRKGLHYFEYFFIPAAGPKAFISSGFEDKMMELIGKGSQSQWMITGSTGSLRAFSLLNTIIKGNDVDHNMILKDQYCQMYYRQGMTGDDLHPSMCEAFSIAAPKDTLKDCLEHPSLKIAVIVCRLRYFQHLPDFLLRIVFLMAWLVNILNHRWMSIFFERICFHSGESPPSELCSDSPFKYVPLTERNTHQVLHATTCIPFISAPCTYIDGLGAGRYLDGGVTDYYLNSALKGSTAGLLLADLDPDSKIPRGALDTFNPFLHSRTSFPKVSLIRPTKNFVMALPSSSLPSVKDWFEADYIQNPEKRHAAWNATYSLSRARWASSLESAIGEI